MSDIFTAKKRSEVMSRIRGKGNRETEMALVRLLREEHITGWRRHYPIPGRPDFVFPKARVALFVDGCFWHQCPKHSNVPANNRKFWEDKLGRNVERDRDVTQTLTERGWRVLRIWEHELRGADRVTARILREIGTGRR